MTPERSGLKTPERSDRRSKRLTDCPVCGQPIDGLAADDRTTIEPCGHSARGLTTTSMTTNDTTSDAYRVMTDGGKSWRDYDTYLMQQGHTRNNYFHAVDHCPAIRDADKTVERSQSYVAYHEPEPCTMCHPELTVQDGAPQLVIVSAGDRGTRYHRREDCGVVSMMDETERVCLSTVDLEPCKRCAGGDRDDAEDIRVCPACDQPHIQAIIGSPHQSHDVDADYRCNSCGERFDEPDERARQQDPGNPGGLAGKLMNADPEDVSAEHVGGGSA